MTLDSVMRRSNPLHATCGEGPVTWRYLALSAAILSAAFLRLGVSFQRILSLVDPNRAVAKEAIDRAPNAPKRPISSAELRGICIERRGASGRWYVDEDFGRQTFYASASGSRSERWWNTEGRHNASLVYEGNRFNWRDTSLLGYDASSLPPPRNGTSAENSAVGDDAGDRRQKEERRQDSCQISAVDQPSFCETTRALGIRNILMVGDSLMVGQMNSLRNLVGNFTLAPVAAGLPRGNFVLDGVCPGNRTVWLRIRKENLGANLLRPVSPFDRGYHLKDLQHFGPETPHCYGEESMGPDGLCPWQREYRDGFAAAAPPPPLRLEGNRTLLVLNQGAHFHSAASFRESFDRFVEGFNAIARPGDIVAFRSTVPGHRDCFSVFDRTLPPPVEEMTYDKFLERYATDEYDWNLFDGYNAYARDAMATNLTPSVRSFYLNVYNMTVLRPDQHVEKMDCLHYTYPGPVDFWNHLLFSNLADLAKIEEEQSQMNE